MQLRDYQIFLGRLLNVMQLSRSSVDLHEQVAALLTHSEDPIVSAATDDWTPGFVHLCQSLQLQATLLHATPREALRRLSAGQPLVTYDHAHDRLVMVVKRGRHRPWVEYSDGAEGRWVQRRRLFAAIGQSSSNTPVHWLAIDPATPLSSLAGLPSPLARLRGLLRLERQDIGIVAIYSAAAGLLALGTPIAVQALVNTVSFGALLQPLFILVLILFAALSFRAVILALETWVVEVLQRRLFVRLVADLAHRLPRVEHHAFDRSSGPEKLNRFFDIFNLQKSGASLLVDGLGALLTAFVGLLLLAFYHPLLLAFDIVLVASVILILRGLGNGATRAALDESTSKYRVASWLQDIVRHPSIFKSASGASYAEARLDALASDYLASRHGHFRIVMRQVVGALGLQVLANSTLLGIGGWLVLRRELTLGQLVASELVVGAVVGSLTTMGKHLESYYELVASTDKLGYLIDLPMEPKRWRLSAPKSADGPLSVQAQELRCSYGDQVVFDQAAFTIGAGQHTALIGAPGVGRSTLLQALYGLRTPSSGRILIDGTDLAELRRDKLRDRVALVERKAAVFEGTLLDNLRLGHQRVGDQEVQQALRLVGLPAFSLTSKPFSSQAMLSTGGLPLSQRDVLRLALARAIATRPGLLLLDDVLDGWDAATETKLLDSLFDPAAPWTIIVATSEVAVRARCQQVLAFGGGAIRNAASGGA